jgi:hypothetical protein
MAAPTYVNSGALFNNVNTASATIQLPGSRVNGNLMLLPFSVQAIKTLTISGAGWNTGDSSTTNTTSIWLWRLVDGTETAPVISWTGASLCSGIITQWTGNISPNPIGNIQKANGTTSPITNAAQTSSANNSLILAIQQCKTNQAIGFPAIPSVWVNHPGINALSGGAFTVLDGPLYVSGSVTDPVSCAITSTDWHSYGIEILGSGTTANQPQMRTTQNVLQVGRAVPPSKETTKIWIFG